MENLVSLFVAIIFYMTDQYIVNTRLKSQQIADTKFDKPFEIVNWMGAMQAQDFEMVK